jgi:hypothetical protein
MTTDRDRPSKGSELEPEVKVAPSGGNWIAVVLVLVVTLIVVALSFMLFGVGSEGSQRSDPPSTTVE